MFWGVGREEVKGAGVGGGLRGLRIKYESSLRARVAPRETKELSGVGFLAGFGLGDRGAVGRTHADEGEAQGMHQYASGPVSSSPE